jgi:hypothetical protein
MVGVIGAAALVMFYQGVKETAKYTYTAPGFSKKVKGMGDWMELRYRFPSPGNISFNGDRAARELEQQHYKTPYDSSKFQLRNYRTPGEDGVWKTTRVNIDVASLTPEQEATVFNYIEGDTEGNAAKKEHWTSYFEKRAQANDAQVMEAVNRLTSNPTELYHSFMKNCRELEKFNELLPEEPPNASPYIAGPDTFIAEYGLSNLSSYELQLYIELEDMLDNWRDDVQVEGQKVKTGDTRNWKVLDETHRKDQAQEVIFYLKQRNLKEEEGK